MVNNKPLLRFKGFVDPWEFKKLGEIANIYDGVHQTPEYKTSGIPFLSVENIKTLKTSKYISLDDFNRDYKNYPVIGDILMTRIGDVGTTNIYTSNKLAAFYVSLTLIKPLNLLDSYYANSYMQCDLFQNCLANRTLTTAIPQKINLNEIVLLDFAAPSLPEQTKIGRLFRNIDTLIENEENKYKKLLDIKKSLLNKMFPLENTYIPSIRFNGYSENWEFKSLGEMLNYEQPGKYIVSCGILEEKTSIQVLTAGNSLVLGYTAEKDNIKQASQSNPIIIFDDFTTSCHLIKFPHKVKSSALKFLSTKDNNNDLYFSFLSIKNLEYQPVTHARHWIQTISKIVTATPSLSEQIKIGKLFNSLDNLIDLSKSKTLKLKTIKQSLLNQMFI